MKLYTIEKPFVFIIFGASGDLAKTKLFPAMYALAVQKRLASDFIILGFARTPKTRNQFQKEFRQSVYSRIDEPIDETILNQLIQKVYFLQGFYDQKESFQSLAQYAKSLMKGKIETAIAYLAVPPEAFSSIITNLSAIRKDLCNDTRLIIEKPFGHDEKSAQSLFHHVSLHFPQEKVFLLDHYLGKEGVQSILSLRYANGILNTLLNGSLIANIQITAFEDFGVEGRVHYFEQVGIIKDMIQSHLLQILALLTMELPIEQDALSIHREKISVLSALKYRGHKQSLILGQYESYCSLEGVKKDSKTPTFAALRLFIDRQNWYDVPIFIRTGKMLKKKHAYVVVEFKKHDFQMNHKDIESNKLIIELQPNEKIHLKLYTKVGGSQKRFHDLTTSESLACFGDDCLPEHGRLLLNVFQNDHSNFLSFEEIVASWRFTDILLNWIKMKKIKVNRYKDFSDGPLEQHLITKNDHFEWLDVPLEA